MSLLGGGEKVAAAGAVMAAAFASMCCILPLGLGAVGLSGALVSAFFEALRPYFLALAGGLIGLGFYLSFRSAGNAEACSTSSSRLSRASRPALFVAALATGALALFPSISGWASGAAEPLVREVASNVVVLRVEGMTCESCAPAVRARLLDVPGVLDAAVSYERKVAEVRIREERAPDAALLIGAVEKAGYAAALEQR